MAFSVDIVLTVAWTPSLQRPTPCAELWTLGSKASRSHGGTHFESSALCSVSTPGSSYIALPWWAGQALFGTLSLDVMVLTVLYSIAGLGIAIVNDFKSIEVCDKQLGGRLGG